ncbi:MAG TPA: DUF3524 domain-containing protein, partial [Cellvibrionaceae bacterium]|nr:DUF3524 domain-containing protein [Cellvibrionaceae bacterium]
AYDLILATSMVDLATLRGLVPALSRTPCIYYCHENQFAYPESPRQMRPLEPLMVTLYGALAADKVVFNSHWNQQSFFAGVAELLNKMPDKVPAGLVSRIEAKACVLPVPLRQSAPAVKTAAPFSPERPLHILWNHRWEFDKGPDLLLALIEAIPEGLPLRWHIVGQGFRSQPAEFTRMQTLLDGQLASWGFAEAAAYQEILAQSHLVLSTAWHDFQGLAILEAASLGAVPLVPAGLAYPQWFSACHCYGTAEDFGRRDIAALAASAAAAITAYAEGTKALVPADTRQWQWPELKPAYRQLFESMGR